MPLVFVHGVATRKSVEYDRILRLRDSLFTQIALAGIGAPKPVTVINPYWGDSGASFAWNHASLPGEKNESFGSTLALANDLLINATDASQLSADPDATIVGIARISPEAAVDVLFGMTAFDDAGASAATLATAAQRALEYVRRHDGFPWLASVRTDTAFVDHLCREMATDDVHPEGDETFGFGGALVTALKTAATRVATVAQGTAQGARQVVRSAPRAATAPFVHALRPGLDDRVTTFVGDVIVYVTSRGTHATPGTIVTIVRDAIATAQRAHPDRQHDPIIIVAHSLGGVIVYDLLTSYCQDLDCDVLVTVGSQVALFEEMKCYRASQPGLVGPRASVPKPRNVKHWINVFDVNDVLAYSASSVFTDVGDYAFDTGKTVLGAHSAYFVRPSFHERLNARLKAVWP
jgi:hypothetical protein